MMMRHRLRSRSDPKTALVTGASRGIGRAFAKALPRSTNLIITGRDEESRRALNAELGSERRGTVGIADLATDEGQDAVVDAAAEMPIDLLINNAGAGQFGRFLDSTSNTHRTALRVNAEAMTVLCSRLLPEMLARARLEGRRAGLINVISTAAFASVPQMGVYAASKAYALSFTEMLINELKREPVDVLAVIPGPVRTEFGERAGYEGGNIPGAIAPERVAQKALDALGNRDVVFTDAPSELTLTPLMRARGRLSQGIDFGINAMQRFRQRAS